ncbi:MAG: hypothetical protein LBU95_01860 [Rikenellaceae bacterium]|jgi:hypothetical protein|nr:hypothetical protein [Rikenellaceae bacterium]
MKKLLYIILPLASLGLYAQEGLNRQVEVTKAYTPEVGQAVKLSPLPRMEDTVALRPRISYSIRPAGWQTAFGVKPITAAGIDTRLQAWQPSLYVKAGLGAPLQSVGDIYFHQNRERASYGAYVNHRGQYDDLKNDLSLWAPAKWSTNRAGIYGGLQTGERLRLDAAVDYDWNYYTRYGLAVPAAQNGQLIYPGEPRALSYSAPRGSVTFGNDFTDLSFWNFNVGLRGGYFADREDNDQTHFGFSAAVGKRFNFGALTLDAAWDQWRGGGKWLDGYKNRILQFTPMYRLQAQKFRLTAGLNAAFADNTGDSDVWVFPRLRMSWDAVKGYFVPFVDITGSLTDNGFESLARRTPFITSGINGFGPAATVNTARYDLHGGISGSFSSSFAYKVYGGASFYRSRIAMVYLYDEANTGSFIPAAQDVVQLTIGGDLSARVWHGLEALLDLRVHAYPENVSRDKAADLPDLELGVGLRYTWRERLILTAGIDLTGNRYFYGALPSDTEPVQMFIDRTQDPVADLHFSAEYTFLRRWGVFVEARNLLDQKLYPWNHYREAGVNGMAGVKFTF